MSVFVRFAPSPTGYLHVGNIRTALVNWLFAHAAGGSFLLRMDDTDTERSRPEYVVAIEEDLTWLGLTWNKYTKQSEHFSLYNEAKELLIRDGRLYPCFETQEELDIKRKMQAGRGIAPVYDRAALKLTDEQKKLFEAQGRVPHWRFLLEEKDVNWHDLVRGEVKFTAGHLSDPVLFRADGVPTYTLASVVDDGMLGITHIIRGEDHVSNTAVQVQLFEALGYKVPDFGHLALLKTKEGELSKRTGGSDIRSLRQRGILPMAINSLLARLGTSDAIEPCEKLQKLVESFDISKFGRAPATYDPLELERLNAKLLSHLPFSTVAPMLIGIGITGVEEKLWNAVRGNIHSLAEIGDWLAIIHQPLPADGLDKAFLAQAASLLPPEPWNETTWSAWTQAVKEATGKKGKELFLPLRLALTGREDGPELKALLPLIGRKATQKRLVS